MCFHGNGSHFENAKVIIHLIVYSKREYILIHEDWWKRGKVKTPPFCVSIAWKLKIVQLIPLGLNIIPMNFQENLVRHLLF